MRLFQKILEYPNKKSLNSPWYPVKTRKEPVAKEKPVLKELLDLKEKTSWSWERMCREFHRVMGEEGPSHTTLHRYATGKVQRRNALTERYVWEAINKVTVELVQKDLLESESQRKGAEHDLRQVEMRFRRLVENSKDIIFRLRLFPKRGFEYISPAVTDIFGYTPAEIYAEPDLSLRIIHPDDRELFKPYFRGEGPSDPLILRGVHKDGSSIWVEESVVPIQDEEGNVVALEGISRDVTERLRAEREFRELQDRFRNLVENTNDILWEIDPEGTYTYVSPNVQEVLGYNPQEVIGKTPFEFMPDVEVERVSQIFTQIVHDKRSFTSLQHKAVCKDGSVLLLECSGRPIPDGNGSFRGYRGIDRDITKRGDV